MKRVLVCIGFLVGAASAAAGRGGSFIDMHTAALSKFDQALGGSPVIIGGMGCFHATDSLCIGAGGGGAFGTASGNQVSDFRMGYGGVYAEYGLLDWLHARLLLGGGGYRAMSISAETRSQRLMKKIGEGGFWTAQPTVTAQWSITRTFSLGLNAGYFIASVSELNSPTIGLHLLMGNGE